MITPIVIHTADGLNDTYPVPFPYIHKSHVVVSVDGVVKTNSIDYTWATAGSVQFNVIPAAGVSIKFERSTPTDPLVRFQPSAALTVDDLQTSSLQSLYRMEEMEADVERAFKLDPTVTGVSTIMPPKDPGKVLVWGFGPGAGLENGDVTGTGDLLLRGDLNSSAAGKGAELVKFKVPGTGTIDRTLLDRALERVSVKDFGAQGDGVADDTTAIMAGITHVAANGGVLYFPDGTYNVTATLDLQSAAKPFMIKGESTRGAVLHRVSTNPGSMFNISGVDDFEITDLTLNYDDTTYPSSDPATSGHGISISNGNNIKIRRLHLLDWVNSAILIFHYPGLPVPVGAQEENNVIEDCYCDGMGSANNGVLLVDQFYSYIRGCTVINLGKAGSPQVGLQFKNRCYRCHIHDSIAINARSGVSAGEQDVTGVAAEQCMVSNVIVRDCVWGVRLGKTAYSTFDHIVIDMAGQGSAPIELNDAIENTFTNLNLRAQQTTSAYSVACKGTSSRNHIHFAFLNVPDTIPEIVQFEPSTSNNTVHVSSLKTTAPLLYTAQGVDDQTTIPSGNSLTIDGYETQESVTIAAGVIKVKDPATRYVRVDTEASAATDDLVTITGNGRDGQVIVLKANNAGRTVVIKHGTGNIYLKALADTTLAAIEGRSVLQYDAGVAKWCEL